MKRAIISLAVFILLWWGLVRVFEVPAYLVPSPADLGAKAWFLTTQAGLFSHVPVTVFEILAGFVIGTVVGVLTAVLFARAPLVELVLNPLIIFVQTAPKIAIAPLLLLWLGLGATPKIVLVAIVTFFPVLSNMLSALRSIDPNLLSLARILRMNPLQRLWRIELPQSVPLLFAGMKVGVTLAVTAAVIGELMGARAGLGYLLSLGQETADVGLVLVAVILLSLVGYVLYLLLGIAERRMLSWHESREALDNLAVE
ncbi:ABC transporter inner membrane protein [Nitratireductor indicus C115]|uniref:ABC transporter inner membrane protein n=1 Tax=Nitratireductor indicus C115 TaxID=1231190 RepID=K2PPQ1_9HYPH|nr:ABC transporter permease [Nitratireductor indicus]EKF43052.1 ABC transporter inner membrane protein [Nitratireductor indicus C115]SFQ52402.1 NitT/TauT family transport system permease protein [Nitratireductor indicus]